MDRLDRRCEVTGNLCGTDTWEARTPCKCRQCQTWLMEEMTRLQTAVSEAQRSEKNAIKRMDEIGVEAATLKQERDAAREQLRECSTCEGDGVMSAVVGYNPHEGEILEDAECAECHGTGVSSWGQAIDKAERLERENAELREALRSVTRLLEYAERMYTGDTQGACPWCSAENFHKADCVMASAVNAANDLLSDTSAPESAGEEK